MDFNRWWDRDVDEVFWMELTDRPMDEVGVDLKSVQDREESDRAFYGNSLITQVDDGDIVFHYHKTPKAIVGWSRAEGAYWEEEIEWVAHGTAARGKRPRVRPGWKRTLRDYTPLPTPLTLDHLRSHETEVRRVRDSVEDRFGKRGFGIYFPFALSDKRPLRPNQAYLTKFPLDLVRRFEQLAKPVVEGVEATRQERLPGNAKRATTQLGAAYRNADEAAAVFAGDPHQIDPSIVERGVRGHAITQNLLAQEVRRAGVSPLSSAPGDPPFDLLWVYDDVVFVAEVKSLTLKNEEKQLRLGLGQVLRYKHVLAASSRKVQAVLAVERPPTDTSWLGLCDSLDVLLSWPERFSELTQR